MKIFNDIKFIKQILSFSPRQGVRELLVAEFIENFLSEKDIAFEEQIFETAFPDCKKAEIRADGKILACKGTCFVGGKIASKSHLISSLTSSQNFINTENINFNPKSKFLSLSNYYFAPSVCIENSSLSKIISANKVTAEVKISKIEHQSKNILVGNIGDPKVIVFSHFDSVEMGAVDNASGIAIMMRAIMENPKLLEENLFVFAGNEELSYDEPVYWGHGYREFEKKYTKLLRGASRLIVIDSVGNGKAVVSKDSGLQKLAFPIKKLKEFSEKIALIYGDLDRLMEVYHSDGDNISQIKPEHLDSALLALKKECSLKY